MINTDIFHFEDDRPNFEALGRTNGSRYWYASDLMVVLGYKSMQSFREAVNKALGVCMTLGIPVAENFKETTRTVEGQEQQDYKLSRFACYLTAMNADSKKPEVAAAQAYFAAFHEAARQYIESSENVERVVIRGDISERERSLSGVAHAAGVTEYAFFQSAGYRGLYNMNLSDLRTRKGINPRRSPLDFMGKEELAANLFRITQTELKIKNENIRGQNGLEVAAETVGRAVRKTMIDLSGTRPENLPAAGDIKQVHTHLKKAAKQFKELDSKALPPEPESSEPQE